MTKITSLAGHIGLVGLGLLTFAAPKIADAQDTLSATFGDWHTFCDKGRICDAYTYSAWQSSKNPKAGHVFTLSRYPGTDAWLISITFDGVEPDVSFGLEASVIRYGHDQPPIPPIFRDSLVLYKNWTGPGSKDSFVLYLLGPSTEIMMQRLRLGDILDFAFGGCNEEFLFTGFSLAGITAALAWIDEVQGVPPGSIKVAQAPGTEDGPLPNCGG